MYTSHHLFGQIYESYQYSEPTVQGPSQASIAILIFGLLFVGAAAVFAIIASCKLYQKAGRKWWEALIPIYSTYVSLKIIGRPGWWLLLFLIPFVGLIFAIITTFDLAKAFGKGFGTGLLLLFFPIIMYPLLAFGSKYQYKGPVAGEVKTIPDTPYPAPAQSSASDTTPPGLPTHTEPAPTAPEVPSSTPPDDQSKQ